MRIRPFLRRALAAGAAVALISTLSACSVTALAAKLVDDASGKNDTIQPAEIHNGALAAEAEALLAVIQEDSWEPPLGGNILSPCDAPDTYAFYGSWFSSELAQPPADAETAAVAIDRLSAWLESRGWSDIEEFDFTTDSVGVNALGISAWHESIGVTDMQVIFYYEGDVGVDYTHTEVDVDSDCLPADMDPANPDSGGPFIPAVNTA